MISERNSNRKAQRPRGTGPFGVWFSYLPFLRAVFLLGVEIAHAGSFLGVLVYFWLVSWGACFVFRLVSWGACVFLRIASSLGVPVAIGKPTRARRRSVARLELRIR